MKPSRAFSCRVGLIPSQPGVGFCESGAIGLRPAIISLAAQGSWFSEVEKEADRCCWGRRVGIHDPGSTALAANLG
jgi:hypothetical protein